MTITDVRWVRDHRHRRVLELSMDNHPAHFPSKQKVKLLRAGLLQGLDFFASEWRAQADHQFIHGTIAPGLTESDLAGSTNDPQVFALYQEMCQAIADGSWRPGARELLCTPEPTRPDTRSP